MHTDVSLSGGGTVLWFFASNMSEPAGMSHSMLVDNEALCRSVWAIESMHFQVDSSTASGSPQKSTSAVKFEVTTYQETYQIGVFARYFIGNLCYLIVTRSQENIIVSRVQLLLLLLIIFNLTMHV